MLNFDWVKKIQLEVVDEEDGGMNLIFTWDEKDPELQLWTEWGEEKRREFILGALERAAKQTEVN
jgi:hypothetical protein